MPNWCYNSLEIKTTDEDRLKVIKKAYDEGKLLSHLVPPPNTDDYEKTGWYDWNVENWGTKWDACCDSECDITCKGDIYTLSCSFNTAWAPAIEGIENWFRNYDPPDNCEAILTYNECGMCFCGVYCIKDDDEIDIDEFNYYLEYSNDEGFNKLKDLKNHESKYVSDYLYNVIECEIEDGTDQWLFDSGE